MGEVIELKTKEKKLIAPWEIFNPKAEKITINKHQYEHDMRMKDNKEEHIYCLEEYIGKLKIMTLWDRIFNWPY